MELILNETISALGREGDVVTVKPGYGRNYLLPQGKAVNATAENLTALEQNRAAIEARLTKDQAKADKLAKKISNHKIVIEQLSGEDERLFGSVTNADIAAKLEESNIKIDKKQILLIDPIKTLGETTVQIKIGFDVTAEILIKVVPLDTKE